MKSENNGKITFSFDKFHVDEDRLLMTYLVQSEKVIIGVVALQSFTTASAAVGGGNKQEGKARKSTNSFCTVAELPFTAHTKIGITSDPNEGATSQPTNVIEYLRVE